MKIYNENSLETMKKAGDMQFDLVFCDPPYALGSEVIIRADGKPDYKKAVDFMSKWKMPNGDFWAEFYAESFRALKHGGYLIMFGLDRQLLLFKYYAAQAGFQEHQSIYWYFISNFPKASDLSKNIDKFFKQEREITGFDKRISMSDGRIAYGKWKDENEGVYPLTSASHPLAKKYDGYKYSIAPLKQTNETVMIFHKPYLTGSCLHDALAYESGNENITVGAVKIKGNEVGVDFDNETDKRLTKNVNNISRGKHTSSTVKFPDGNENQMYNSDGRYPAQTFVDSGCAEVLDLQSGDLVSKYGHSKNSVVGPNNTYGEGLLRDENGTINKYFGQIGGCSKILHKCDYELGEFDLYQYCPKVSPAEREAGLSAIPDIIFEDGQWKYKEGFESLTSSNMPMRSKDLIHEYIGNDGSNTDRNTKTTNNHPTLKPIALIKNIAKLFKLPNPQNLCIPFSGAGSEIIGFILAGYDKELITASEINPDYIEISKARIEYWTKVHKYNLNQKPKKSPEKDVNQQSFFVEC